MNNNNNKKLLESASVGSEELCRSRRVSSSVILARWITHPPLVSTSCYSGTPSGIVLAARSLGFVILERNNSHEQFLFYLSSEEGDKIKAVYLDDVLSVEWRQEITERKNIFP